MAQSVVPEAMYEDVLIMLGILPADTQPRFVTRTPNGDAAFSATGLRLYRELCRQYGLLARFGTLRTWDELLELDYAIQLAAAERELIQALDDMEAQPSGQLGFEREVRAALAVTHSRGAGSWESETKRASQWRDERLLRTKARVPAPSNRASPVPSEPARECLFFGDH
jgi:hypothetical protein